MATHKAPQTSSASVAPLEIADAARAEGAERDDAPLAVIVEEADDAAIVQRAHAAVAALDAEQRAIEARYDAADTRLAALATQERARSERLAIARRAHAVSVQAAAERAAHLALATAGTVASTMLQNQLTRLEAERDAAEHDLAAAEAAAERDEAEAAAERKRIRAEQRRDAQRLTEIERERETFERLGAEAHERLGVATQAEIDADLATQHARIVALQGDLRAAEEALRQTRMQAVERLDAWADRARAYTPRRQQATLSDLALRWHELAAWLEDHGEEVARSTAASPRSIEQLQGEKLDQVFAITAVDLHRLLTGVIRDDRDTWGGRDSRFAAWRHKMELARRYAQDAAQTTRHAAD